MYLDIIISNKFNIYSLANLCGQPYEPSNSRLTCSTEENGELQRCVLSCTDGYVLTLANPTVQCESQVGDWTPHLDNNICKSMLHHLIFYFCIMH